MKIARSLQAVAALAAVGLLATWLMFKGSLVQTQLNWDAEAPVTGLSQAWLYSAGVVFAASTGLMLVLDLWRIATGKL